MTAKITLRPQHGDVVIERDDWPTVLVVRGYLRPRIEVATDRHRNEAEHRRLATKIDEVER